MIRDTTSDDYKDLKAELRSILISSQQGCSEQQLMKDYAAYNGSKDIPFREMGYRSLIDLLLSMPDAARIDQTRLPIIIHGVADQTTAHIKQMVMLQKRKKKPANTRPSFNRTNYQPYRMNNPNTYTRNRPNIYSSTQNTVPFQPFTQINNSQKPVWDVPNLMDDSNRTNKPLTNSKMVASFPPKSTLTPPLMSSSDLTSVRATPTPDDSSSIIDDDLNYSADDELIFYDTERAKEYGENIIELRKRIRQLLLQFPKGVWLTNVPRLYQKHFHEELKLEDYRIKTLIAFFDCVSDFVESRRDGRAESTDRLFLLKPNFTEAAQREQQRQTTPVHQQHRVVQLNETINSFSNEIHRSIVDLSSFVSLDFQYRTIEYTSSEPFTGFLGDVENPWNIHLGNVQFIPNRNRMMIELREHYNQYSDQSIYLIPFEQIHIHLCCVYYHTDKQYYRALVYHIDPTVNNDLLILKLYLVDFGYIISNVSFHTNSTNLKFLHRNFSTLSTQVYDCRLANVCYPPTLMQWSDDAKQFILDLCDGIDFQVEILGTIDGFYSIYLWNDYKNRQSINDLLIQRGFAIELKDTEYSEFEPNVHRPFDSQRVNPSSLGGELKYVNENLTSKVNFDYNLNENNMKYLRISIQHGYYFIKHPYTKRPCLPCFELAKLLNKDENFISHLNLIRATELPLNDSYRSLYDQLINIDQSRACPHLHANRDDPKIFIYDLSSIRDYLLKMKYNDGDVLDAFQREYENYERPGYWNETKNSYITENNLQTHENTLNHQQNLFNFRKNQLLSLSKQSDENNIPLRTELSQMNSKLQTIEQELTTIRHIQPSILDNDNDDDHQQQQQRIKSKLSKKKMRDTLFRIARPFDQQFSLNICFHHQLLTHEQIDDEVDERFHDLGRIMKNILQFFLLESDLFTKEHQRLLNQADDILPDLINDQYSLVERIDMYNYCLEIIEQLQPIIRSYVQRTDLIDTIY